MKKKAASTPKKKSATPVPSRKAAKKSAKLAPALYKASPTLRPAFYDSIARVLLTARRKAYRAIDSCMVEAYWDVGRRMVEEEQHGKKRADYGTALLHHLSLRLAQDFGPGYDERELRRMRQFYRCFPIRGTLCPELSWSHYRLLIRVEDPVARTWYMQEAASQNWSVRALNRQIHSLYYQRLLSSRNKRPVIAEMLDQTGALAPSPRDFIRDPVVLEFLDLPVGTASLRESRLEQAIIGRLQHFLLELGKGFAFVARQQRVSTETKDFFIDLVFYNYILKCFVLIDLKVGELTHADIGQMDMYVRLYEDQHKGKGDNPTVGLILCTEKDQTVVKYSVLKNSKQLFASKYQLYLPSEEELRIELERERDVALREDPTLYGGETSTREEAE
jgi:predicted nuclease of restriction endonuclease-like (RecB) superfamily